jgi:predicted metalloprotease with PDZ domain
MLLIRESKGQANLDNLLRDMYQEYYLKKDIWFTEEDLEKELIKRLGEKGKAFLQDYVYGLKRPDWKKEFGAFGIRIADRNEENKALSLGIRLQSSGQRMTVQSLPSNGPAHNSGLHIGDEIIAIGDRRIESPELGSVLNSIKAGQEVEILYSRNGRVLITKVMAAPEPGKSFRLDWDEKATPDQDFLRKKWLRLD